VEAKAKKQLGLIPACCYHYCNLLLLQLVVHLVEASNATLMICCWRYHYLQTWYIELLHFTSFLLLFLKPCCKLCKCNHHSMAFLWLSITFYQTICKSFMTSFRCFFRIPVLVMAIWVMVWSLALFPTCFLHWTALEDLFPWQDLQVHFWYTHKHTHSWRQADTPFERTEYR